MGFRRMRSAASAVSKSLQRAPAVVSFKFWAAPQTLAVISLLSAVVCLASVATIAVLAVRVVSHNTQPAGAGSVSDTRAWLSPVSIALKSEPLRPDGKPRIDITLNYVNVGREPARGVVVDMRSGTVPQDLSSATLNAVFAGDNTTCDSLITPDKGGMVFPSSIAPRSYSQTDVMANQEMIEARQGVLVVQACMKYQTAGGAIHTTKVCEYVEPEMDKPLDQRRMRACADGNDAN